MTMNSTNQPKKLLVQHRSILFAFLAIGVSACSSDKSSEVVIVDGQSTFSMVPPSIIDARAIDFNTLLPVVNISGTPITMVADGEQWIGSASVSANADLTVNVEWVQDAGDQLLLASAQRSISNIREDVSVNFVDSDYVTEGVRFDADSDGISNIAELRQDTGPFDANDPGVTTGDLQQPAPQVRVVAQPRATLIDGRYDAIWNNATHTSEAGEPLAINNLLVDETDTYNDQGANYGWSAIHDGTFLTLFVYGKSLDAAANANAGGPGVVNPTGDSPFEAFNDDSLEIFLDGDLLRETRDYDTVDDVHIIIPLVTEVDGDLVANNSDLVTARVEFGPNMQQAVEMGIDTADASQLKFANCLCEGPNERVIWEVRLNLAAFNIPLGQTFGFELQINQDDDGGTRDSKWAWWSPSRQPGQNNTDADLTWRFSDWTGLIQLAPLPQL